MARTTPCPKLLLVEDNPVNQTVALWMLAQLNYKADVANNGCEALAALRQKPYDLVLLDVEMPEMDGLTAAQQITADWPPAERPYLIALTAYAMAGDREKCLQAGMQDYLTKPLRMTDLAVAIERGLQHRPLLQPPAGAVASSSPGDGMAVLDPSIFNEVIGMVGADQAMPMIQQLMGLYRQDTPQRLEAIAAAIAAQDPTALYQAAHALRSSSLNVGGVKVAALCRQLEDMGKQNKMADSTALHEPLLQAVEATLQAMADYLQEMRSGQLIS